MKKLIFNLALITVFIGSSLYFQGCYPDNTLTYQETDIALTGYYDSVDFQLILTYYMPDTVFPYSDDTTNIVPVENQDVILNQIAVNMQNYGYTRVYPGDITPEPDVMVNASAIVTTTVSVGWWYPYYPGWGWGWYYWKKSPEETNYYYYPGYYPPGWGWGGVPYYSSYTTGTLMVEMANPEDYRVNDGDTVVPLYWAGGLNGVLSGSSDVSRITGEIDQLFTQSPYLDHN